MIRFEKKVVGFGFHLRLLEIIKKLAHEYRLSIFLISYFFIIFYESVWKESCRIRFSSRIIKNYKKLAHEYRPGIFLVSNFFIIRFEKKVVGFGFHLGLLESKKVSPRISAQYFSFFLLSYFFYDSVWKESCRIRLSSSIIRNYKKVSPRISA